MSRSADARAEVALLEALGQGPLDVLDLVQALRKDAGWVRLRPELVCEVTFDYLQGMRMRHAAAFRRWPETSPTWRPGPRTDRWRPTTSPAAP